MKWLAFVILVLLGRVCVCFRMQHRGTLFQHKLLRISKTRVNANGKSFVEDELRTYAVKLHTKDQAKGGQQEAQVPFTKWEPTRADFLRFLVDSLHVYETMEEQVAKYPALAILRGTGLERAAALRQDVQWMLEYDRSLELPPLGEAGRSYGEYLRKIAGSVPAFVCHFYSQYFAHTAGGLRIGNSLMVKLLEGNRLQFYTWSSKEKGVSEVVSGGEGASAHAPVVGGNTALYGSREEAEYVESCKEGLRARIDSLAAGWTVEERLACCEETASCFHFGHALLSYLRGSTGGSYAGSGSSAVSSTSTGKLAEGRSAHLGGGAEAHVAPIA
jgi:hypothetical protein